MELGTLLSPKKFWQFKIDGKLIYECEANSWVRNFLRALHAAFAETGISDYLTDINNNAQPAYGTAYLNCTATAGTTTIGIVVGSSNQAFSYTDYKLISQITNIVHQPCNIQMIENDTKILIDRNFYNNTGSSITIREVGLYAYCSPGIYSYCIERTVLSQGITLNNGQLLTVTFTISLA